MNISASAPICSAIEKVPTDQASLEAVLGFMVDAILSGAPRKGKRPAVTRNRFTLRSLADRKGEGTRAEGKGWRNHGGKQFPTETTPSSRPSRWRDSHVLRYGLRHGRTCASVARLKFFDALARD